MTREELDDALKCFKTEIKDDLRQEVKSNSVWVKWVLGFLIAGMSGFAGYVVKDLSFIKGTYMSKAEFKLEKDNLKLEITNLKTEITKKFSIPVQISQAQLRQIRAKIVDRNEAEYQQAKADEYRLTQEMIKMNYDITRGGESNTPY